MISKSTAINASLFIICTLIFIGSYLPSNWFQYFREHFLSPKKSNSQKMYFPNPGAYPEYYDKNNPIHKAVILHREVRNCSDRSLMGVPQIIKLQEADGKKLYFNYLCRNRYQEQCYKDGSFDKYYDEWCEDAYGQRIALP